MGVQGKGMGFGWIAYGFGLAFFFAILTLGYISAHVNPAMCLGLLIVGKINGVEFIALSLSEFAGMFVGAVFVYVRPSVLPLALSGQSCRSHQHPPQSNEALIANASMHMVPIRVPACARECGAAQCRVCASA